MNPLKTKLVICTLALVGAGCTGGFSSSKSEPVTAENSGVPGAPPKVTITSPAAQLETRSDLQIGGTCTTGLNVEITGEIEPVASASCVDGAFSSYVRLVGADGLKSFSVSQTDVFDQTASDARIVLKDETAPSLIFLAPGSNAWAASSLATSGTCETGIDVIATIGGSSYRMPCTNGTFQGALNLTNADGVTDLTIEQLDRAGNRGSNRRSFRKDTIAPVVAVLAPISGSTVTSPLAIQGSCETGTDVVLSGSGLASTMTAPCNQSSFSVSAALSANDGAKTITFDQTDRAGNRATAVSLNVVRRELSPPPTIRITAPAANSLSRGTLTLTGTCESTFTVNVSGSGVAQPSSTACASGAFTAAVTLSTGEGTKTISVSQTNTMGTTGSDARVFVKDSTAPTLTIASPASNSTTAATLMIVGACETGLSVMFSGAGLANPTSVMCANSTYSSTLTLSTGDGTKLVTVAQADAAGNQATVSRSFVKDTTAPIVAFTAPAANTEAETGLTITGTCESGLTITVSGTGVQSSTTTPCTSNAFSTTIVFSSMDGTKIVDLAQTDGAGNTGRTTRTFVRKSPPPDGAVLYAQHCAGCHAPLDTSTKRGRTSAQISGAIAQIGTMQSLIFLTTAQIDAIALALQVPQQPVANIYTCDASEEPETLDARRLTKQQTYDSLRSLFSRALGDTDAATLLTQANVMGRLPNDASSPFTTGDINFSAFHTRAMFDIADLVAAGVVTTANYSRFVSTFINYSRGSCSYTDPSNLSQACRDQLIRNFTLRAWGRPIEETTTNSNNEMAAFQREFSLATTTTAGVEAMVFKTLVSPEFLFHLQIDVTASGGFHRLSSYAIARRLSFAFMQTAPDESLLAMAASQDLMNETSFGNALEYVSQRMDGNVDRFAREWLKLDQLPIYKDQADPKFLQITQGLVVDQALRTAMVDEIPELFNYLQRNDRPARELFTTNISFARNPSLMRIYNVTTAAPSVVTETNAIRFPAGERSGLMTRAALLFSGGHTENTVRRGGHIRSQLFCLTVSDPPPNVVGALEPPVEDPTLTTRERYHNKTSSQTCVGCHAQLNPIGYALSKYNAFGAFQRTEPIYGANRQFVRDLPTNSIAHLGVALGIDREVQDGIELGQVTVDSANHRRCMTQKFFTYSRGLSQAPTTTNSCSMSRMYQTLLNGGTLRDFFKSSVSDPKYRYRKIAP